MAYLMKLGEVEGRRCGAGLRSSPWVCKRDCGVVQLAFRYPVAESRPAAIYCTGGSEDALLACYARIRDPGARAYARGRLIWKSDTHWNNAPTLVLSSRPDLYSPRFSSLAGCSQPFHPGRPPTVRAALCGRPPTHRNRPVVSSSRRVGRDPMRAVQLLTIKCAAETKRTSPGEERPEWAWRWYVSASGVDNYRIASVWRDRSSPNRYRVEGTADRPEVRRIRGRLIHFDHGYCRSRPASSAWPDLSNYDDP